MFEWHWGNQWIFQALEKFIEVLKNGEQKHYMEFFCKQQLKIFSKQITHVLGWE